MLYELLEKTNYVLSGMLVPVLLIGAGIYFSARLRAFYLLHPVRTVGAMCRGTGLKSSFRALTMALAGTLGVGNIAGVAAAIYSGGEGAVLWMLISATAAMSVKYAEVYLAVLYRKRDTGEKIGGAMYYMRYGMANRIGERRAAALGGVFAVLCASNSVVTGNIVQVNAAAAVYPQIPAHVTGIIVAALTLAVTLGGVRRISDVTLRLIPILSVVYIVLSVYIIVRWRAYLPEVIGDIFRGAADFRSVAGGIFGFTVSRAMRFGVTRGIFSNEAGCGTAPTAHASADTDDPHRQACFGIFEVFADTIVLCTMTALVILTAEKRCTTELSGIPLSLASYGCLAGGAAYHIIGISVILFAFATVICQSYYGVAALGYFTASEKVRRSYLVIFSLSCIVGATITADFMWQAADLTVSVMTVLNVICLTFMRRDVVPNYTQKSGVQ